MAVLAFALIAAPVGVKEATVIRPGNGKMSYRIGADAARNFQRLGIDLDLGISVKALRDVYTGQKLLLTEDDPRTTMTVFRAALRQIQIEVVRVDAETSK
jgi:hypothetical protein